MGSYTGTVPTFAANDIPTADQFAEIVNFMTAETGVWTAYTPTWAASAGTPSLGNGSLTGSYRRIGKTVDFRMQFTAGSSTTFGTAGAYWAFGLPPIGTCSGYYAFALRMIDYATKEYLGMASMANGASEFEMFQSGAGGTGYGRIANNSPFTFGTSDGLWTNGTYELA